ncbi:hypothetical protein FNE58_09770, partial [Bacillus thuringiensis]|nr:hypothetical protein [Bacillus thuringiensis]
YKLNRRIRNRMYGGVRGARIITLFSLYSIYIIFAFALRTVTYRRITKQKTGQSFPFGLTCFLLSDSGKLARG